MLENLLHSALSTGIRSGDLSIHYPSGRTKRYGDGTEPHVTVRLADSGALRGLVTDPTLRVPELYMEERLLIEKGNVYDLIALARSNLEGTRATPGATLQNLRRQITDAPVLRRVGLRRARGNVAHHYDLDERLYRLFLDRDMQYSCAYFEEPGVSLDQAQLAKKRLIAAKLLVRPDAHVLDIGSGWGGMALYLARVCGARVTGITLSEEQLRVATERAQAAGLSDRVTFRLQDYREVAETFDNIVSVGMFEHVGLRQYPDYFAAAARLLAPDGVMLLHTMVMPTPQTYNQPFIDKYIFPGGYLPSLSQMTPEVERAGLLMRDIEVLTLHYAETTRAWRERFLARREEAEALYDSWFVRMWEFYLAGSEATFRFDDLHVAHLQLAHEQTRVPLTRSYIADEMDRLKSLEAAIPDYAALHEAPARRRMTG